MIDLAEDRDRFKQLLNELDPAPADQRHRPRARPRRARSPRQVGYPIVIRPSYVLGGRAMRSCSTPSARPLPRAAGQRSRPALGTRGLAEAPAADRPLPSPTPSRSTSTAWPDGEDATIVGIMEHIEEGRHPFRRQRLRAAAALARRGCDRRAGAPRPRALALALEVGGLMNVQYASRTATSTCSRSIPRASRTVPFVAKVIGLPVAKIAARIMAGESWRASSSRAPQFDHIGSRRRCFRSRASRGRLPCWGRR
jgi:carbamoyl-phosphate synthase large subunit